MFAPCTTVLRQDEASHGLESAIIQYCCIQMLMNRCSCATESIAVSNRQQRAAAVVPAPAAVVPHLLLRLCLLLLMILVGVEGGQFLSVLEDNARRVRMVAGVCCTRTCS
jgi:hypothetical protein